jgi:hypothetical protein
VKSAVTPVCHQDSLEYEIVDQRVLLVEEALRFEMPHSTQLATLPILSRVRQHVRCPAVSAKLSVFLSVKEKGPEGPDP